MPLLTSVLWCCAAAASCSIDTCWCRRPSKSGLVSTHNNAFGESKLAHMYDVPTHLQSILVAPLLLRMWSHVRYSCQNYCFRTAPVVKNAFSAALAYIPKDCASITIHSNALWHIVQGRMLFTDQPGCMQHVPNRQLHHALVAKLPKYRCISTKMPGGRCCLRACCYLWPAMPQQTSATI